MSLTTLVFSDLFVAATPADSWFKATPDSLAVQRIPVECEQELEQLRQRLMEQNGKSGFGVDWPTPDGVRLRVERIAVADSKVIFVCRRFRIAPGTLASLGMPSGVAKSLMAPTLTEGLVVLLGKAGSGKTTTAASFVIERLIHFGGVCWTVENPIELALQGQHGQGWCYQTEAASDDGIGPAIRDLMRATPNIIFIGELRDGLAVRAAIAASTSGHLVVATFHAADLKSGIARLARLAEEESASAGIADALRVAVHLSLHNHAPENGNQGAALTIPNSRGTGTPARVLSAETLWVSGTASDAIKSIVRDGSFHLLTSEVERQRRSFIMGKLP